jgi:hypothetical protein
MNAPKIQSNGKKMPKKNIQPCPLRSVLMPSQMKSTTQISAPIPIPHHIAGLLSIDVIRVLAHGERSPAVSGRFGFVDTSEVEEGELVMRLPLD